MLNRHMLKALFHPSLALSALWRRVPIGSFRLRLACDALPRTHYAYCMYNAALLASRVGAKKLSVVEFGVAGGNGLVAMEWIAEQVERLFPVEFEIYGFDTGEGLPPPEDYRDLAYDYRHGDFPMDQHALQARLGRSKLVLGNVKDTVPQFFEVHSPAPIGFVAIDLDFYSSTREALKIFDASHESLLPRIFCYLDDIIGADWVLYSDWVGELLAVKEFNETHETRKIAPVHGLRHKRAIERLWNDKVYAFHDFHHPLYNKFMRPDPTMTLKLRD